MNAKVDSSHGFPGLRWALAVFALLLSGWLRADPTPDDLITVEKGDLPIILSAPHGGGKEIPGVAVRKGVGIRQFVTSSDVSTDRLTEDLADAIEDRLGARPYVVIARFHRKYLDANRPAERAYESALAKPFHDRYHEALAEARRDVARRWGSGLLLDVHGQRAAPDAIYRGTQNGRTTNHLVGKFGRDALTGRGSLFGQIAAQGIRVIPPAESEDRETKYQGGYIVVEHGSASGGSIDAIQLELGRQLRSAKAKTAEQLANAIVAYSADYLPKDQKKPVRVGVYRDVGAGRSVADLMRTLDMMGGVEVEGLMAEDIRGGALSTLDVLIQPGGTGGAQGRHLQETGREKIREFVREGGGLIGICAGAYLASADYDWSLDVLDAKVLDRKHWARGTGMVEISLSDVGRRWLRSEKGQLEIYYAQGPLLAPAGKDEIEDYEVVASFRTEIAKNGAPRGVMKGTTAIARGTFGQGRVVCFSPHPEKTKGLEGLVHDAIDYVKRRAAK